MITDFRTFEGAEQDMSATDAIKAVKAGMRKALRALGCKPVDTNTVSYAGKDGDTIAINFQNGRGNSRDSAYMFINVGALQQNRIEDILPLGLGIDPANTPIDGDRLEFEVAGFVRGFGTPCVVASQAEVDRVVAEMSALLAECVRKDAYSIDRFLRKYYKRDTSIVGMTREQYMLRARPLAIARAWRSEPDVARMYGLEELDLDNVETMDNFL